MESDDQLIINRINEFCEGTDIVVKVTAPVTLQVSNDKNEWRSKKIDGSTEFIMRGVRKGVRNGLLFRFEPIDARDYTLAESPETKVFQFFPELEAMIVPALTDKVVGFTTAKKHYLKAYKKEAEEAAKKEALDAYCDNDQWGIF